MRITCPLCGPRDRREFYYYGSEDYLTRPEGEDWDAIDAHLHLRNNPAGRVRDLWYHDMGCTSWLVVTRDTVTHEVFGAALVADGGVSISAKMKSKGGAA
ncbi:sarcosine oxidase subunit delta [Pseudorhodobacter ferrugineus]|uniref:sarcosine oxidase subunit delta n=1 Tax=Pseudorhodobacter ferrugineus TaxID=77008 RepID=UPI0003B551A6|nr:sarcosine oxidase subunit delta [Pseudorhodobacter ferrugineus]